MCTKHITHHSGTRWQHANSCIIERDCVVCDVQLEAEKTTEHWTYNTTQHCQMAALQLLCYTDKEKTNTEAMHQHVNIMTQNNDEHLHYKTHLVCVKE
jgi:hypothetical protein